ncbi:MFS transporter [Novosphingobium sp. FSY-8]|uniref:MFS transporter n=1 Tax=Novosphingobium ovatum TaxID=1908523 RepID=A0ABW9XFW2_9SPHN|nr:MFS transporter [Novosphingobium ovatum]NBC37431.1 MFS transporter [Novosphingobium ovatum]
MTTTQRRVAVLLLALLNAFGFIDRVLVALVAERIKADYLLNDFQIGLLGGTAFAIVNAMASVPIARMAERTNRARLTALFLLVGSGFTALLGQAGSFAQLLACRLGMAVGSAATEAPPHSMISDMYPPERRASAISLFMLGVPLAALFGSFAGGAIAQAYGWRATFHAFGLVGGGIGVICLLWLKEPARMAPETAARPGTLAVLRLMGSSRVLSLIVAGVACISLGSYGVNTFLPAFFSRHFGMDTAQAGLMFGLISGVASMVGTLAGGYGAQWAARRGAGRMLWVPAAGVWLGVPLFLLGMASGVLPVAVGLMLVGSCGFYMAMGPAIATLHGHLDSYSRATGSALFLVIIHMVGQGFGPPMVGRLSDVLSQALYGGVGGFAADCARGVAASPACAAASAGGLQWSIAAFSLFFVVGGVLLAMATRGTSAMREAAHA